MEGNFRGFPMIPAYPGSPGASGLTVPEMIVERHYKASMVSFEPLREHHSLGRPTYSRSSLFVEVVEDTAWPQARVRAKSVAVVERGEVVG